MRRSRPVTALPIRASVAAVVLAFVLGLPARGEPITWARQAPPGSYVLDPQTARLSARMAVLGFSRFTVKFTRLEGSLEHDPNRPERSRVSITVDPRSAAASNAAAARRTVALFEPDRYPTISFASRGVSSQDGREQLAGDLTLHGVTRPVTLDLNVRSIEAGTPGRPARVSFSGAGRIRRSDFAVVALRGVVGDQVDLLFDVDFVAR